MNDAIILKDVLRQYEGQETHTVHLVYTPKNKHFYNQKQAVSKVNVKKDVKPMTLATQQSQQNNNSNSQQQRQQQQLPQTTTQSATVNSEPNNGLR